MTLTRRLIDPVAPAALRSLGARRGWLVDSPDVLRVGVGGSLGEVTLANGLEDTTGALAALRDVELRGDDGPRGTGVVALGSLPFHRAAPGTLTMPRYLITQSAEGTWVTGPDDGWRELLAAEAATLQDPQVARSVTYRPSPEEYAHNVATAVEVLRRKEIDKVVLARAVVGTVERAIDCGAVTTAAVLL